MTAHDGNGQEGEQKARIFISYSRKDMAFADRLDLSLKERGFEPLIDREEIYAFEDWWKRIEALIARADTVVFVVSPDSVASREALKEVQYAASLNKRFAPIVCRRTEDSATPDALRRLNFIFFDDPARFEASADQLVEALQTDIGWIRQHTIYGDAAREWVMAGRPGGLLLRSPALEAAERWVATRPHNAPAPTEDTQAFVAESRTGASRRRNIVTTSLAAGLILALALAGLAYWQRSVAIKQTEIAVEQTALASKQRDTVLLQQSQFLAGVSRQQTETEHNAATGLLLALEALPDAKSGDPITKSRPYWAPAEVSLEAAVRALHDEVDFRSHTDRVTSVAVMPDGVRAVTGSADRTARLWDLKTGKELLVLRGHTDAVLSVAVTADGTRVVTGSDDGTARVWDATTGKQLLALADGGGFVACAATVDGDRIVTGSGKIVHLWDAKTGAELKKFELDEGTIESVAVTPDGSRIVAGLFNPGHAQVWDAITGAPLVTLTGHTAGGIDSVAISADGSRIVTGARSFGFTEHDVDNTARLWDAQTGEILNVFRGHTDGITSVAITPDGRRVATASMDRSVRLWDANGAELLVLGGHTDPIWGVAVTPDATRVVTAAGALKPGYGSDDNTARAWNTAGQGVAMEYAAAAGQVMAVAVTPDGSRVVLGGYEYQRSDLNIGQLVTIGEAAVVDARTGKILFILSGHSHSVTAVAVSPDGARIVTGSDDHTARVWDAQVGTELSRLEGHAGRVTSVAVTPDGSRLVTGSSDKTARLWDLNAGTELLIFKGHAGTVTGVAVMPDGTRILTGSDDGTARLWDVASGKELRVFKADADIVTCVAVMPDGKRIVTGSDDGTARVWDVVSGKELLVLGGHDGDVSAVAVTADGARIMTAESGLGKAVRVWDATTGALQAVLRGAGEGKETSVAAGEGGIKSIAAMPDGNGIVIATIDHRDLLNRTNNNSTRIWPLYPTGQELIDEAKLRVRRCLSPAQRQSFNLSPTPPQWCVSEQKWPYDSGTVLLEIWKLLGKQQDREALARSESAVALDASLAPKIDAVWVRQLINRGEALIYYKQPVDQARAAFDAAITRARGNPELRSPLGDALVDRAMTFAANGQFDNALRDLREAESLGNPDAALAIWVTTMAELSSLIEHNPEQALLGAVTTSLNAAPQTIATVAPAIGRWASVVTRSIGLVHGRLAQLPTSAVDPCDQLAANPDDPLRKGNGVSPGGMDTTRAIAACDAAWTNHPDEPRYLYQRGRAQKIAANAAIANGDKAKAGANTSAATADFEAAMAAGYPMAFYNMALASENDDADSAGAKKAAAYALQALNRVLQCCWTPVARHLLTKDVERDKSSVSRVVGEMTSWAAALGNPSSRDLLAELAANGTVTSANPLPIAAFADLPPWLRANVPAPTR